MSRNYQFPPPLTRDEKPCLDASACSANPLLAYYQKSLAEYDGPAWHEQALETITVDDLAEDDSDPVDPSEF